MTPMIDVVFQLIIFFLVSSHLAKQEANVQLQLPEADSGQNSSEDQERVTVNVLENGELVFAGKTISLDELHLRLENAVKIKGKDVEVRIRASRQVPYSEVEKLMLACTKHGIWNVTYSVYRRGEK